MSGDDLATKMYESKAKGVTIEVDMDRCVGDGRCMEACPTGVFEMVDGKSAAVRPDDCVECCQCVETCPTSAIKHSSC